MTVRYPDIFRFDFVVAPSRRKIARVTLGLGGGLFLGQTEKALSNKALNRMLACLQGIDEDFLRAYPDTPRIMDSGVLYREEPPGQEDWQDIPSCLRMGTCDCEDLACWLAAERTVRDGILSKAEYREFKGDDDRTLYHIIVARADGVVEDPSRIFGMR